MLEEKIDALIKALDTNTKAQNAVLAALGGKAAPAAASTDKPAGKPAGTKPAGKPKGPSVEDMAKAVTAFMQEGDKDARAAAKLVVKEIVDHYGVDRFTAIPEESRQEALGFLEAGGVGGSEEGDGEEEEDDTTGLV